MTPSNDSWLYSDVRAALIQTDKSNYKYVLMLGYQFRSIIISNANNIDTDTLYSIEFKEHTSQVTSLLSLY